MQDKNTRQLSRGKGPEEERPNLTSPRFKSKLMSED